MIGITWTKLQDRFFPRFVYTILAPLPLQGVWRKIQIHTHATCATTKDNIPGFGDRLGSLASYQDMLSCSLNSACLRVLSDSERKIMGLSGCNVSGVAVEAVTERMISSKKYGEGCEHEASCGLFLKETIAPTSAGLTWCCNQLASGISALYHIQRYLQEVLQLKAQWPTVHSMDMDLQKNNTILPQPAPD